MNWFTSNNEQKEFIEYTLTQRLLGAIEIDVNNFVFGKYSKNSTREDAVNLPNNIRNSILETLNKFKESLIKLSKIELANCILNAEKELSVYEIEYNISFRTLKTIDLGIKEYNSLGDFQEEFKTLEETPKSKLASKRIRLLELIKILNHF